MPLEFTEVEQPAAPRRLIGKALAAIIVAALIGAAGVYGTVLVVNSFTNRTIDQIVEDADCSDYDIDALGEAPRELVDAAVRFTADYGTIVAFHDAPTPRPGLVNTGVPARYGDTWVILALLYDLGAAAELPDRYEGFAVESCYGGPPPSPGPITP